MDPFVTVDVSLADRGPGARVPLPQGELEHLGKVLRLEPGVPIVVADGRGWSADATFQGEAAELADGARFTPRPRPGLSVLHALPKGRKLDEVVRLLTELGVDRILPVETEHSVVRLHGDRADRAASRWQSVADAAANQARRVWRCQVSAPGSLAGFVTGAGPVTGLVAHVGSERPIGEGIGELPDDIDELWLAVGPEGGWHADEVRDLVTHGFVEVGLGPTVLRTEHAAGVLTAVTSYILGRLG